jgi:hypothetical protein
MSSEDRLRDRQPLVVPFRDADGVKRTHKSHYCDHEFHDVLASPLSEDLALSDDESRQRSVDNILALLKANAELRALAVKLSEILAARGLWHGSGLDQALKVAVSHGGSSRRS